jgi:cold shock CspA family protein
MPNPDNACAKRYTARRGAMRFQGDGYGYRDAEVLQFAQGILFIKQDNGGPDVFVHISAVESAGMRGLAEGPKLTFDIQI